MVSNHCKIAVKTELKNLGLHFIVVDLGEIEIMEDLSSTQREQLKEALFCAGFELMDDKRAILIEKIINVIIEMVYHTSQLIKINFSDFLSEKLKHDYTYLSNIFTEVKGITIQQFIITHKVERIKELIMYNELNLTEISYLMNYSSVAHLSNQFKKITGLSPSHFKLLKDKKRIPIEEIGNTPVHQADLNVIN
jgi:AraC-like DNA-binding protein